MVFLLSIPTVVLETSVKWFVNSYDAARASVKMKLRDAGCRIEADFWIFRLSETDWNSFVILIDV
jgi:hypothetical protein